MLPNTPNIDIRFQVYAQLHAHPKRLNRLDAHERQTVYEALHSLNFKDERRQHRLNRTKLNSIRFKLMSPDHASKVAFHPTTNKIMQIIQKIGFKLLAHFYPGISKENLQNELQIAEAKYSAEVERLNQILRNKTLKLDELYELSRFQTEDALPLYQDIRDFYKTLPLDFAKAEPLLDQKIAEINQKISEAKRGGKEQAYLHILNSEIKKSLSNMRKYQAKNIEIVILEAKQKVEKENLKNFKAEDIQKKLQENFKREVQLSIKAWDNAVNECTEQKHTHQAIDETRSAIDESEAKLRRLKI